MTNLRRILLNIGLCDDNEFELNQIKQICENFIPVSKNIYPAIKQAYLKFSFSERIYL